MNTFEFDSDLVIQHANVTLKFMRRVKDTVYFENLDNGEIQQFLFNEFINKSTSGEIIVLDSKFNGMDLNYDNNNTLLTIDTLNDKAKRRILFFLYIITSLKRLNISRGRREHINELLISLNRDIVYQEQFFDLKLPGVSTIQRVWKKYDEADENFLVLVHKNTFQKHHMPIPYLVESVMDSVIQNKYLTPDRPTISTCYEDVETGIEELKAAGKHTRIWLPSETTFYRRIQAIPVENRLIARYGYPIAKQKLRMLRGQLCSQYPLDVVEIDGTPMDVFVIDRRNNLPLGRPYLILFVDRFSRVITGFSLAFGGENLSGLFAGLRFSLLPPDIKQIFPDVENNWVWGGKANRYLLDNAAAGCSPHFQQSILHLPAGYGYTEAAKPWKKAFVERTLGLIRERLSDNLPGKTFANTISRENYKSEIKALLGIEDLIHILVIHIADIHNQERISKQGPTRNEIWQMGIDEHPVVYPSSIEGLNKTIGRRHNGTLNHLGITRHYLHWGGQYIEKIKNSSSKINPDVNYIINDQDLGKIQVLDEKAHQYVPGFSTSPEYANGLTFTQHQIIIKEAKAMYNINRGVDIQKLISAKAKINDIIENAFHRKKANQCRLFTKFVKTSDAILNPDDSKQADATTNAAQIEQSSHDLWNTIKPYELV